MLYSDRWKILSLIQSEFLLATMVICLDLDDDLNRMHRNGCSGAVISGAVTLNMERQRNKEALQASKTIWMNQRDVSKEAQTAVKAIDMVLSKFARLSAGDHDASLWSSGQESEMLACTTGVASGARSEQGISQNYPMDTAIPGSQDAFEWNELFDLDVPWDSWVQI